MSLATLSNDCSICLEKIRQDAKFLRCAHTFHRPCIDLWLSRRKSCPLCRSRQAVTDSETDHDVTDADDEEEEEEEDEEEQIYDDEFPSDEEELEVEQMSEEEEDEQEMLSDIEEEMDDEHMHSLDTESVGSNAAEEGASDVGREDESARSLSAVMLAVCVFIVIRYYRNRN
uniref:RING-type domain-containing protein n=2 Tax=Anopheles atroparvus TaxID=41427 RepID=A0AAG5DFS4_ANOAO